MSIAPVFFVGNRSVSESACKAAIMRQGLERGMDPKEVDAIVSRAFVPGDENMDAEDARDLISDFTYGIEIII